ncbi:fumarylacetoacetate hydrolase family protein [Paenibacillus roseipurpureus]|uniref:Fumarylacetoacetate hydrolase family protein n=1 Tax=Paenibacillus roseopurpureus TaxID=2918901 RepID=A0AA96RLB1_9BACL|nr:fumarylacetoacetate hydrolase family protein [Paenibacillus sp. MBLB1832]WNR42967.1 fumarylacetoacetate hydrolase family protein [Paenibacillus sp. MBLB1832]
MRIIAYLNGAGERKMAAVPGETEAYPLQGLNFLDLVKAAEEQGITLLALTQKQIQGQGPVAADWTQLRLEQPVQAPEVWAAGVTYERSKEARNYEATEGRMDMTTFYDKVYDAVRPEIFLKSTPARTVGPNGYVSLRSDSFWQIPEPELGLVLNRHGHVIGYIVGNDMSCRDIEGENPLYLPQAKIWRRSCSIGPAIRLADTVEDPYAFQISCRIFRNDKLVTEGHATTGQLKRRLDELVTFLTRDNEIMDGTILLTGTCIVPPNEFSLAEGDRIEIAISGIGTLVNIVKSA